MRLLGSCPASHEVAAGLPEQTATTHPEAVDKGGVPLLSSEKHLMTIKERPSCPYNVLVIIREQFRDYL